jgi:hypothetical protein
VAHRKLGHISDQLVLGRREIHTEVRGGNTAKWPLERSRNGLGCVAQDRNRWQAAVSRMALFAVPYRERNCMNNYGTISLSRRAGLQKY